MAAALWTAIIGSTLCWAAFDAVRKRLVAKIPVAALAFWIAVAQLPGYLMWALVEDAHWSAAYWLPASASFGLNLIANVLFLESVRRGPLSVTIPVLSFTPVFVALGSLPILGEQLSLAQWMGVAVVTGASLFLTARRATMTKPALLVSTFVSTPGVPHMLGVALLWSFSPIFDKLSLRHAGVGLHGALLALSGAAGMALYLGSRRQLSSIPLPRGTLSLVALGGGLNVAALGLQLVAITQMVVSVFESFKRAAGVLLALALGAVFFQERISRTRLFAAICMACGVALVVRG